MSKPHVTDFLIELEQEAAVFRQAVTEGEFNQTLPTQPESTLADVVAALIGNYQFIIDVLQREDTAAPVPAEPQVPSIDREQLLTTFDNTLADVVGALKARPADSVAWNWAPVAKTADFWHHRALNDTALARWDAQMAIGAAEPIKPRLACDIISEALGVFLPAGRRKNTNDEVEGLAQLFAQDADKSWFVRMHDGRVSILSNIESDSALQARAAGSSSDLALALWGRLPFGVTDAVGDERLLQAIRVQ